MGVLKEAHDIEKLYTMYESYEKELDDFKKQSEKEFNDEKCTFLDFENWMSNVSPFFIVWYGNVVGFVLIEYVDIYDAYYISEFYIEPNYRKKGLAKIVFKEILDIAEDSDIFWFVIDTNPARFLWEKLAKKYKLKKVNFKFPEKFGNVLGFYYRKY